MGFLFVFLFAQSMTASPDAGTSDAGAEHSVRSFDPRWSQVATPKAGNPLAMGQPGAGCVQGAAALPLQGAGWVVVHPERHRQFGHPALTSYVRQLAGLARKEKLGLLAVGDLGQPRGGPTPTGHRSHQSGLDVDLWYAPPAKSFSPGKTPAPPAPSVVDLRTNKMLTTWNHRVARLIQTAAASASVDRIFVHPAIKRALCEDKSMRGPWLMKVRPWWGHHDHFHVRLRCPEDSPDCVVPPPLPEGDGCDAIKWWFSEDARKSSAKRGPPGENAPAMPERCEEVLGGNR